MSSGRKKTDASSRLEVDMDSIFDTARARLTEKEDVMQRVTLLGQTIQQQPDLFDAEDIAHVQATMGKLSKEYEAAKQNMREAEELYQRMIYELEKKMGERLEVLDALDRDRGAVSADPELLEYFSKKQAVYRRGMSDAKKLLFDKIREKLSYADNVN
jgi:hypothetical protein